MSFGSGIIGNEEVLRRCIREELMSGDVRITAPLMVGSRQETAYNRTTVADEAFIELVPPKGEYVYLMSIAQSVGTDSDSVEIQALDVASNWRTITNLIGLGNTSAIIEFNNMKLDYVTVGATKYEVAIGDATTATCRAVSRGTGEWRCQIVFFTSK